MAEVHAHAEVRLWGRTVGAVVEMNDGRVIFEYADGFRASGLEISPIHLPLSRRGPIVFDELLRRPAFEGLPGVLADSLPDSFGNKVIRAYFAARGEAERALRPVQRLLYVGQRALGALAFHPPESLPLRAAEIQSLELAELVRDARRIVEGDPEIAIPEIYRIGASAGGMRPKALVRYQPETGLLHSVNAEPQEGEINAILKFDGVGEGGEDFELGTPQPYNRVEAAYTEMARAAGIDATRITMLEAAGHAHLLVHRFDREDGRRLHQHTLGGMLHLDYNDPGTASYEEYLRTILRLGLPYAPVEQGYLRMLFNVVAVNQDDHVKNLSFHLNESGRWSLAPAYDLTFAQGRGFTARHQMRVRDKTAGITAADLLAVGEEFGMNDPSALLERVRDAVAHFPYFATATDVPHAVRRQLVKAHRARAHELDGD